MYAIVDAVLLEDKFIQPAISAYIDIYINESIVPDFRLTCKDQKRLEDMAKWLVLQIKVDCKILR